MSDLGILKGRAQIPAFNEEWELWVKQRGQSPGAALYVRNESSGPVVVTFHSGPDLDPGNLDPTAVTMTLADTRHQKKQDFPVPATVATPPYYHFTRIRASGPVRVEVVSEIDVDCHVRKRPEL